MGQHLLTDAFTSEDDMKGKIVQTLDGVLNSYRKNSPKVHGRVAFSNQMAETILALVLKMMIAEYKIYSRDEAEKLDSFIHKFISLAYLEFKLNDIIA
jgi:hypothetical protein